MNTAPNRILVYGRIRKACCPFSALAPWELDAHAAEITATVLATRTARANLRENLARARQTNGAA